MIIIYYAAENNEKRYNLKRTAFVIIPHKKNYVIIIRNVKLNCIIIRLPAKVLHNYHKKNKKKLNLYHIRIYERIISQSDDRLNIFTS